MANLRIKLVKSLKILDSEGVVRLLKNIKEPVSEYCSEGFGTSRGKAETEIKVFLESFRNGVAVYGIFALDKLVYISAFAAEAEHIDTAEAVKQ